MLYLTTLTASPSPSSPVRPKSLRKTSYFIPAPLACMMAVTCAARISVLLGSVTTFRTSHIVSCSNGYYLSFYPCLGCTSWSRGTKKLVGKDGKPQQYALLAKNIFQEDPKEQARYANNPGKYTTATETRLRRLKNEYKDLVKKLGATGAGLNPAHIKVGSEIEGLIGKIREDWPWWDELHSFWRELPNYNPVGIQSSEPGTDHAAEASNLFQTARDELEHDGSEDYGRYSDVDEEEEEDLDDTPKSEAREKSWSPSPLHRLSFLEEKTRAHKDKPAASVGGRDLGLAKANSTKSATAVTKPKHKKPMTAVDRMQEIREAESTRLARKRELQHKEEMARIQVKKTKYELKLLQAQNDSKHLNKRALTSPSPRRRTRVLNLSTSPARSPKSATLQGLHQLPTLGFPPGIGNSPASRILSLSDSFQFGASFTDSDTFGGGAEPHPDLDTSWLTAAAGQETYASGSGSGGGGKYDWTFPPSGLSSGPSTLT
ncbi:hypothetical protein B0H13DRAFT_2400067 [Mycena leptocephala]|nr:hypothetical protein B0H13DRAFT_2400067 [Mycena leptocephala]